MVYWNFINSTITKMSDSILESLELDFEGKENDIF